MWMTLDPTGAPPPHSTGEQTEARRGHLLTWSRVTAYVPWLDRAEMAAASSASQQGRFGA